MNEAAYKRKLVKAVNSLPTGFAQRVEDRYAVGALDLIVKLPAWPMVWIEGKVVRGQSFGPTERQFKKGVKIEAAGMTALLVGWKGQQMAISPWTDKAVFNASFVGPDHYTTLEEFLYERSRLASGAHQPASPAAFNDLGAP